MELEVGYQQTEVGVIPKDWYVVSLAKVCKFINGRGFKPFEWKTSGLPIIRIQNLNGSDDYNYYQGSYDKKIEIVPGQLLFAWSGSRGTSFGPHLWFGKKGLLNYHTWKVVVNESIDKDFFLFALRKLTKQIEDNAHGASALVHVQKWEIEKFLFPLPMRKSEQAAVASILKDIDSLIGRTKALLEKKQAIKAGAIQGLLSGEKRLPGFSGDWQMHRLGRLGKVYGGLSGKGKSDFYKEGHPYIPFMNVMTNSIIDLTDLGAVRIGPNEQQNLVQKGDLIFNGSSETPEEVGMCAVILNQVPNLYLNSFCFGFRLHNIKEVDGLFIAYYFRSKVGRKLLAALAQGATRYNLSKTNFLKLEFALPSYDEQKAIATLIFDMDAEVRSIEAKLEKYHQIKSGMMQSLLTGQVRLV